MGRALAIAWKDLKHTYRNVPGLAMMLAAPLALTLLLGVAFGGSKGFSLPSTTVAVANLDQAATLSSPSGQAGAPTQPTVASVGQSLVSALSSKELADLLSVKKVATEVDARELVDQGKAVVAVVVPPGLTASLLRSTTGAPGPKVLVYRDPSKGLQAGVVTSVVQQIADGVNGSWAAAAAAVNLSRAADPGHDPGGLAQIATQAEQRYSSISQGQAVALTAREPRVSGAAARKEPGVTAQVLPGMMIFFMFIAAMNAARGILDEDIAGTLPRLFTTPTPRGVILGGKFTSVLAIVLSQTIVLLVAGLLLFRIDWGKAVPVVVLTLAGALAAAGLAVFVLSFLRTPAQAGALSTAVVIILGLVGGNFVGTLSSGGVFDIVRRLTPNGWLLIAWNKTIRGGSLGDILLPIAVVVAFSFVTFAIGVLGFRRRYA